MKRLLDCPPLRGESDQAWHDRWQARLYAAMVADPIEALRAYIDEVGAEVSIEDIEVILRSLEDIALGVTSATETKS